MDQSGPYPPQPPPQYPPQYPPGYSYAPPRPYPPQQVVHIVAKSGGFARAFWFVLGLFILGGVFTVGIVIGVMGILGASQMKTVVMEEPFRSDGNSSVKIAIIPVEGFINSRQAQLVRTFTDHVLADSSFRAVILRVDSPGGGVSASDEIWYEISRLKAAKIPVIASYGGVAASGGYYVSCGADHIIAEESCVTGSIGVIAQIFTMRNLMDKIGVEPVTLVATGSPEKDVANNLFRTWNEQDRAKVMVILDSAYQIFRQRVTDGRKAIITDPTKLDTLANGSIFTAKQALDYGLIDSIGYMDDAVAVAERAARVPAGMADVVRLHVPPPLFGGPMHDFSGPSLPMGHEGLDAESIRRVVNELASPRVMYLMQ